MRKERVMDIGKPDRTYTVEPIEDPLPQKQPEKGDDEPADPEPGRAPEKAPAGA
jgi:hypothetical protein